MPSGRLPVAAVPAATNEILSAVESYPVFLTIRTTGGVRIKNELNCKERENMKLKIIALACVAIAPLALAQTGSGPTSTGERDIAASPSGEISYVNEFTPGKSIKVTRSGVATQPVVYVLAPNVRYVKEDGSPIDPSDIQAGTRVRLDMLGTGPGLTIDRVVVIQTK